MYNSLYYPGPNNTFIRKEIRSAGGEGGIPIIGQILQAIKEKLLTAEKTSSSDLLSLAKVFFPDGTDKASVDELLLKLYCYRSWPMPAGKEAVDRVLREGVAKGIWIIYKMSGDPDADAPAELYRQETGVPLHVNLFDSGYSVMSPAGAKLRGWTETDRIPPEKVRETVQSVLQVSGAATVSDLTATVQQQLGSVEQEDVTGQIQKLIKGSDYSIYKGDRDQSERPEEIVGGLSSRARRCGDFPGGAGEARLADSQPKRFEA